MKRLILQFFATLHMIHIFWRLHFKHVVIWEDKPNWVVQCLAFPISLHDIREGSKDQDELLMLTTFTNTAKKELQKRNLQSYKLFD